MTRTATPVAVVTTAKAPSSEDQRVRIRKYFLSMTIRVACLGLAFVLPMPWMAVAIVGAVVLPMFAVVIGSSTGKRRSVPTVDLFHRSALAAPDQDGNQDGPAR